MKTPKTKVCTGCQKRKPMEQFYNWKNGKYGKNPKCKPCVNVYNREREAKEIEKWRGYHATYARKWVLRREYGMTLDEYTDLYDAQGGLCALCGQSETHAHHRTGRVMTLAVDHCHATGRIRGLLCRACNQTIGRHRDDSAWFRKVADYLDC